MSQMFILDYFFPYQMLVYEQPLYLWMVQTSSNIIFENNNTIFLKKSQNS